MVKKFKFFVEVMIGFAIGQFLGKGIYCIYEYAIMPKTTGNIRILVLEFLANLVAAVIVLILDILAYLIVLHMEKKMMEEEAEEDLEIEEDISVSALPDDSLEEEKAVSVDALSEDL